MPGPGPGRACARVSRRRSPRSPGSRRSWGGRPGRSAAARRPAPAPPRAPRPRSAARRPSRGSGPGPASRAPTRLLIGLMVYAPANSSPAAVTSRPAVRAAPEDRGRRRSAEAGVPPRPGPGTARPVGSSIPSASRAGPSPDNVSVDRLPSTGVHGDPAGHRHVGADPGGRPADVEQRRRPARRAGRTSRTPSTVTGGGGPGHRHRGRPPATAARIRSAWFPGPRPTTGCRRAVGQARAGASRAPDRGTPRCAYPGRPRSCTVVSGPARSTSVTPPPAGPGFPARAGRAAAVDVEEGFGRCDRPAATRPARRWGRCRRTRRPARPSRPGRAVGARPAGARPARRQSRQVREPGREAAERHAELGPRSADRSPGRVKSANERRRRTGPGRRKRWRSRSSRGGPASVGGSGAHVQRSVGQALVDAVEQHRSLAGHDLDGRRARRPTGAATAPHARTPPLHRPDIPAAARRRRPGRILMGHCRNPQ